MALNLPDKIQHNNPNNHVVDSDYVKGGRRYVNDLTALYAIPVDQLKQSVTIVYVQTLQKEYILIDDTNSGNSNGWSEYKPQITTNTYVQNQQVSGQTASFWVTGSGRTDGNMLVAGFQKIGDPAYATGENLSIVPNGAASLLLGKLAGSGGFAPSFRFLGAYSNGSRNTAYFQIGNSGDDTTANFKIGPMFSTVGIISKICLGASTTYAEGKMRIGQTVSSSPSFDPLPMETLDVMGTIRVTGLSTTGSTPVMSGVTMNVIVDEWGRFGVGSATSGGTYTSGSTYTFTNGLVKSGSTVSLGGFSSTTGKTNGLVWDNVNNEAFYQELIDTNFGNTDILFSGHRYHDANGKVLDISNASQITLSTSTTGGTTSVNGYMSYNGLVGTVAYQAISAANTDMGTSARVYAQADGGKGYARMEAGSAYCEIQDEIFTIVLPVGGVMRFPQLSAATGTTPNILVFDSVTKEVGIAPYSGITTGSTVSVTGLLHKTINLQSPSNAENLTLFYTTKAITIAHVADSILGTSTPSASWNINFASARNGYATTVFSTDRTTTNTAGATTTTFANASIPANSWIWFTTSAVSGIINELAIVINYQ